MLLLDLFHPRLETVGSRILFYLSPADVRCLVCAFPDVRPWILSHGGWYLEYYCFPGWCYLNGLDWHFLNLVFPLIGWLSTRASVDEFRSMNSYLLDHLFTGFRCYPVVPTSLCIGAWGPVLEDVCFRGDITGLRSGVLFTLDLDYTHLFVESYRSLSGEVSRSFTRGFPCFRGIRSQPFFVHCDSLPVEYYRGYILHGFCAIDVGECSRRFWQFRSPGYLPIIPFVFLCHFYRSHLRSASSTQGPFLPLLFNFVEYSGFLDLIERYFLPVLTKYC